jgi:multiple sugar transport system ATP-binding protein
MARIAVDTLSKSFGGFTAVREASFIVEDGEFFALLGPSGCGKTTTLRMIAGLELPTSGRILLGEEDVTFARASRRDIAFVFQLFALYPHMTVRRNLAFPLLCTGTPKAETARRVAEAARLLRIEHLLDRRVGGLSSGDRQRVALGRALVRRPKAFMMDEPLGALDAEFRHLMCDELRALHDSIRATTVYVTHDQLEAMAMADKIAVMNCGRIEQCGTPREIYATPSSIFVAEFVGSPPMNLLDFRGSVAPGDASVRINGATVPVPAFRTAAEGTLTLGVRAEQIRFDDASALRGTVFGSEYLGRTQLVAVDTGYGRVRARLPADQIVRTGETIGLAFETPRLSVFDRGTGRVLRSALHEGTIDG